MPDVEFVRFNDVDDLRAKFSNEVCGICIEPLQGEGGIHPVSQEFFAAARELCDSTGALLLADEIQCGLGRTGKWFAYQHYGILPDITTLAKPIANGIPMGAMLCTDEAALGIHARHARHHLRRRPAGLRGRHRRHRHDASARTCSAHIQEVGEFFKSKLQELATRHDCIVDVRGMGLMLGVELNSAELAKQVAAQMMERRIIINRTSETVLRFLPPFILERKHVEIAVNALDEILKDHAAYAGTAPAGEQAHG